VYVVDLGDPLMAAQVRIFRRAGNTFTQTHRGQWLLFRYAKERVTKKFVAQAARFVRDEDGISAIEYGLLAALIALAIVGTVGTLGTTLSTIFTNVAGSI
jgi:pilus assembly protein Flp/PilA